MGAMGTGSTLLRLMLDSHEHIAIPRETGFMRAFNANKFIPFKWSGRGWYQRLGWSDEEWDAHLGTFYDTAFRRLLEKEGKTRWGDKTPYHTWHIDDMARVFPDAQFIVMVRHPGGCVASNVTRWDGQKNPVFAYSLPRAAYHYLKYHTEIARQASHYSDRFTVVRYEDLVLQPEALMRELLDWLGEFWGYAVEDPLTFDSLAPAGRVLIRGEDVEARIPQFGDIDFNTQPPVPRADRFYHPRDMKLAGVATDSADGQPTPAEERPWPRTRIRRAALPVVRRLPQPARRRLASAAKRRWERGLST